MPLCSLLLLLGVHKQISAQESPPRIENPCQKRDKDSAPRAAERTVSAHMQYYSRAVGEIVQGTNSDFF